MLPKTARPDDFAYRTPIQLRWGDFDLFDHVNNVAYYSYFEHITLTFYREHLGLDVVQGPLLCLVVENGCRFLAPIDSGEYKDAGRMITGGLRVVRLGRSSVTYNLGLFAPDSAEPAALAYWIHVFVGRHSQRPEPITDPARARLAALVAGPIED